MPWKAEAFGLEPVLYFQLCTGYLSCPIGKWESNKQAFNCVEVKETAFDLLQDLLFYDTLRISVNGKERKLGKSTLQREEQIASEESL